MRWWRSAARSVAMPDRQVVITFTDPLDAATAPALSARVTRAAASAHVLLDLTGIPDFDSVGAGAVADLQDALGGERLTIIGFRQATARIIGVDDLLPAPALGIDVTTSGWLVRRLRAIAVVQCRPGQVVTTDDLEPALAAALGEQADIVVVDLLGARLTRAGLQAIAFASSAAALDGKELLVVNVDALTGDRLRRAGLSGTTYVAPEPLPDS